MKIWLDDFRPAPDSSWTVCTTAEEAIEYIHTQDVTDISFDHDLGEGKRTGYYVALIMEALAIKRKLRHPISWRVHSMNPSGRDRIVAVMQNIDRIMNYQYHP